MRTAKMTPAAYYVDCPQCGENLENPTDGSFLFNSNEIYGNETTNTDTLHCATCGTVGCPRS